MFAREHGWIRDCCKRMADNDNVGKDSAKEANDGGNGGPAGGGRFQKHHGRNDFGLPSSNLTCFFPEWL